MSKTDELKKEAEEYAEQCYGWCNNDQVTDVAIATYITSAEPREKRIEELEKNLKLWTDTKDARENIFFQQKRKIADLEKENAELELTNNKLKEQLSLRYNLEDKIALLEQQIEKMKCCANCEKYFVDCKMEDVTEEEYFRANAFCKHWELRR